MTEHEPRTIRQIRSMTLLLVAAAFMAVVSGGSGFVVHAVPGAPIADNAAGGDDGGAKGSVWVVNRDLGELAIFDAETGTLIEKLAVGAGAHDICISEKAGKAYITAEAINAVTTVDIETLAKGSIPVGPLPHHIEPSHDGRKHLRHPGLASDDRSGAWNPRVRDHRHRRQLGDLHGHQCERCGANARRLSNARWRPDVRGPRHGQRGLGCRRGDRGTSSSASRRSSERRKSSRHASAISCGSRRAATAR